MWSALSMHQMVSKRNATIVRSGIIMDHLYDQLYSSAGRILKIRTASKGT